MSSPFEPWFRLDREPALVRLTRTSTPFSTLTEVERGHRAVVDALEALPQPRGAVLVDLRDVSGRNDPEFERAVAPLRKRIFLGFERSAVLVRSAIGRLQLQRHLAEDGLGTRAFDDLDAAFAYLRG